MKKLILFLCVFFTYLTSFSQLTINQSVSPAGPYKVGDTLTVSYNVVRGTTKPRYVWLRYNYDNKALVMVPNSTSFGQGSSSQTFYTHWDNYLFTPKTNVADTQLYAQYQATPWGYAANADYNVGQLTVQRTDAFIDGVLATQKYVIKDKNTYTDIHKLSLAYAINDTSANISPITTSPGKFSLTNVTGNGINAKANITIANGVAIAATISESGTGYVVGDVLGIGTIGSNSLGSNARLSIVSIANTSELILDGVQGDFIVSGVGNTVRYINNFGITTTLNSFSGGNVQISEINVVNDGLHIVVNHKNHGMYFEQNYVTISNVQSDVTPTKLSVSYDSTSTSPIS
ncbi:MAG: hypothetical protein EB100_07425, partial [Crocinitomicaceae bacterium]|nr:hypothetical protein [Crocinitomicaceae bacterium]